MKRHFFKPKNNLCRTALVLLGAGVWLAGCAKDPLNDRPGGQGRTVTVTLPPLEVAQPAGAAAPQNSTSINASAPQNGQATAASAASPCAPSRTTAGAANGPQAVRAKTSGLRIDVQNSRGAFASIDGPATPGGWGRTAGNSAVGNSAAGSASESISGNAAGNASGSISGNASPATRAAHPAFTNVWVLQFAARGGLLQSNNIGTVAAGEGVTATMTIDEGSTVCIVANGPASGLAPSTLTEFQRSAEMAFATPDELAASVPYTGMLADVDVVEHDGDAHIVAADGQPLTVWLTPCAATLTAVVDWQVAGWSVTSLELYRVPLKVRYLLDPATESSDYPMHAPGNFAHIDRGVFDDGWAAATTSTGSVITGVWTLADNLHIGEMIDSDAPDYLRDHAHAAEYATFVRVRAGEAAGSKSVSFDVYPGDGTPENYDQLRNHGYITRIAISGATEDLEAYAAEDDRVQFTPELAVDENGILVLKGAGEERGRMLFFRFGSVVGFTQEGAWAADKVLFNPVEGSPDYSSYTSIPFYASADYNAGRTNVSDPAYHNGANVKAGKGDPCKLVGLSAKRIQDMSAAELDAYDSGWRLPTKEENLTFTGQTANGNYSAHWTASDARYDKWYYSTGSAGGYFPKGQESQKKNYLPAAGYRWYSDGAAFDVGVDGHYWSSEACSNAEASCLVFGGGGLGPLETNIYESCSGARCVKEPELAVDENGILVLTKGSDRGQMLFFRFGSVVGFTQEGDWAADKVLFNPVEGSPDYSNYMSIPVYASADFNAGRTDISAAAYHNGTNVKAGKGDPCKLAGLSAKRIQSMTAAELDAYDSGWRLPTKEENLAFTGQDGNVMYSTHWTASDARYDKWYYSTGSAGGYFPKGSEGNKANYLPATGYRTDGGSATVVGNGIYWCRDAYNSSKSYSLSFASSFVAPLNDIDYGYGFGARCVRTTP